MTLPLAELPIELSGMSIVAVSDLHVGGPSSRSLDALDQLAGLRPDLVVAVGDLAESVRWLGHVAERLVAIGATAGTFAVWGNHDIFGPPEPADPTWLQYSARPLPAMRTILQDHGVQLLSHESAQLTVRGQPFQLVGIDEVRLPAESVRLAFAKADPAVPTVVLAHNPDAAYEMEHVRADLVICGHTHGGQIVLPFVGALKTATRRNLPRAHGLMQIHGRHVVVSAGIGTVGIPLRMGVPSEALLIRLVRPA